MYLYPIFVGFPVLGSINATLEMSIGLSISIIPPS